LIKPIDLVRILNELAEADFTTISILAIIYYY